MDRLTLNLSAARIMGEFGLDERQYGQLESAFAFAVAVGAIIFGWLADRWNVRLLYPLALLAWSAVKTPSCVVFEGFVSALTDCVPPTYAIDTAASAMADTTAPRVIDFVFVDEFGVWPEFIRFPSYSPCFI